MTALRWRCSVVAGVQEFLRPFTIQALHDAFAPAQLSERIFAAQASKDHADLFF